ncbi:MAG: efflux RND transporter permease subunit [Caldithrix sp.]|nr:MAG: efflux RND transporter permease subunit [Caldithrix sp.]
MDLTKIALEKRRITGVVLLLILVSGLLSYKNMSRAEDPGFIIRAAQIRTFFPGASPERVESLLTDKLEKKIQEMPELDFVGSTSKSGISIITVNIKESYSDMRPIWDKLRRKVDDARGDLPSETIGPFVNDEFGDVFGTVIALTGEGFTYAEMKEIADNVRDELLLIEEIAKVDIYGAQEERVFVEFSNARLAELGVSPGQMKSIIEARNIIFPGGELFTEDEQIVLEPSGNFESVEELSRTVIKLPGQSGLVYLGDVTQVKRGYIDPPTSKVNFNGNPALVLAISMRAGGNIITLGDAVQEQVARFKSVYPIGIDFNIVYFQPGFVDKKVNDFVINLIEAVGIVILVMLVFLGLRTGLVIASLIPMAMVMALLIMGFLDIGLDQMSLAALIIALGMLVDNAIVMSESIMVQMEEGKPAMKAAFDSARELRIPLLVSSLTTAAAFLPIYLAESTVGEYTSPIFEVVTITLISSWILALTMTPLLCVLFIRVKPNAQDKGFNSKFYRTYRKTLLLLLRHPMLTVVGAVILLIAALQLTPFIPKIFFPANDKPVMYGELRLPVGTPLAKTEKMVSELDAFIKSELQVVPGKDAHASDRGVLTWCAFIGSGAPRYNLGYGPEPPSPEFAYLIFNLTSREIMDSVLIPKLERYCRSNFPDLTAKFAPLALGPPVDAPVQVRISGKDIDKVFEIVEQMKERLGRIQGTKDITDNWGQRTKKLFVRINQPRAQRAGLTSQDIAISLQSIMSGIETTDYREGDEVIPVVLRSIAADRKDVGKLESHNIYVQATGQAVPLKQVADVEVQFQPAKILRRDRLKTVTVDAQLFPGYNAIAIANEIGAWLSEESTIWPIGYKYELGGEIEASGKANDSIMVKLPIAGLLIVLLLVGQFDSLRRPAIILLTIPFGLIGVFIGLVITQEPLGFVALLGIIALAGIVINNAIVLIDRIKIEIEENGLDPAHAVVESAQRRLRPILLTTATTVGGLVPLWLGGGPMFAAMAVAILFGLMFATVLTLGLVPTLYSIFFKVNFSAFAEE